MQQLRSEIVGYFGAASAFDERVAAKFKLSRTDMRCLDLLDHQGPMTAGQLADETGLSTGAVTFLLDRLGGGGVAVARLEEAGMVTRRRDTDDRRRVWVALVPSAHKRMARMQQPIVEEMRVVAQRFKEEELAVVRDFMRETKEVFERQVAGVKGAKKGPDKG